MSQATNVPYQEIQVDAAPNIRGLLSLVDGVLRDELFKDPDSRSYQILSIRYGCCFVFEEEQVALTQKAFALASDPKPQLHVHQLISTCRSLLDSFGIQANGNIAINMCEYSGNYAPEDIFLWALEQLTEPSESAQPCHRQPCEVTKQIENCSTTVEAMSVYIDIHAVISQLVIPHNKSRKTIGYYDWLGSSNDLSLDVMLTLFANTSTIAAYIPDELLTRLHATDQKTTAQAPSDLLAKTEAFFSKAVPNWAQLIDDKNYAAIADWLILSDKKRPTSVKKWRIDTMREGWRINGRRACFSLYRLLMEQHASAEEASEFFRFNILPFFPAEDRALYSAPCRKRQVGISQKQMRTMILSQRFAEIAEIISTAVPASNETWRLGSMGNWTAPDGTRACGSFARALKSIMPDGETRAAYFEENILPFMREDIRARYDEPTHQWKNMMHTDDDKAQIAFMLSELEHGSVDPNTAIWSPGTINAWSSPSEGNLGRKFFNALHKRYGKQIAEKMAATIVKFLPDKMRRNFVVAPFQELLSQRDFKHIAGLISQLYFAIDPSARNWNLTHVKNASFFTPGVPTRYFVGSRFYKALLEHTGSESAAAFMFNDKIMPFLPKEWQGHFRMELDWQNGSRDEIVRTRILEKLGLPSDATQMETKEWQIARAKLIHVYANDLRRWKIATPVGCGHCTFSELMVDAFGEFHLKPWHISPLGRGVFKALLSEKCDEDTFAAEADLAIIKDVLNGDMSSITALFENELRKISVWTAKDLKKEHQARSALAKMIEDILVMGEDCPVSLKVLWRMANSYTRKTIENDFNERNNEHVQEANIADVSSDIDASIDLQAIMANLEQRDRLIFGRYLSGEVGLDAPEVIQVIAKVRTQLRIEI